MNREISYFVRRLETSSGAERPQAKILAPPLLLLHVYVISFFEKTDVFDQISLSLFHCQSSVDVSINAIYRIRRRKNVRQLLSDLLKRQKKKTIIH